MEKDDLLNIKPKKNIKKPLVYGAIAFLIFIIGVIAYAIYSNSKEENVVLPPQVNNQPEEKSTEFKEIPIEEDTNTLSQKLTSDTQIEINTSADKNDSLEEDIKSAEEEIIPQKKSNKKQSVSKKEIAKTSEKKVVKKEIKKHNIKKIVKTRYYIQVAALMRYKKPNEKFLNLIKKEGFNYTFYHTYFVRNNQKIPITKILIGPFKDEKTARKELEKVKEKITQNAFIFKVK